MHFHVLGPLAVRAHDGTAVRLASRRQRFVLARLLVADGQVVPAERLLEDVWGPAAASGSLGALQTTISLLRRALEPDRPPRAPARLLVSAAPGYALRAQDVDARGFEQELHRDDVASLDRALALWAGPAYAEVAQLPWAQPEATRLEELRLAARERRAALLVDQGAGATVVGDLEALVADAPLREEAWRLLALALYRAGRQGDALAALRRARAILAEELGIDPGPRLRDLETAILDQALDLDGRVAGSSPPAPPAQVATPARRARPDEIRLVGRDRERDRLLALADQGVEAGAPQTALVAGEAGIGKTSLALGVAGHLASHGWRTAWGRCSETDGAPALWPWIQVLEDLAAEVPLTAAERDTLDLEAGARGLAAPAARFRLLRGLRDYLARVAADRPLAVILDDLHRADESTLAAIRELSTDGRGALFVLGTFRAEEAPLLLLDTLAAGASIGGLRLGLDGLSDAAVATLVRAVCDRTGVADRADAHAIGAIIDRTEGNPFYVTESARLLASEGRVVADGEVPAGVADVIRRRLARLPAPAQSVLQTVAVVGREADVRVVVAVDVHAEDDVLDALETAVVAGVLQEPAAGTVRFSHTLVRDTVYHELPRLRRARAHARVAAVLLEHRPDDVTALAHHHVEAAAVGDVRAALRWCRAAAAQAEQRFSHTAAMGWWERARDLASRHRPTVGPREEVEVLTGLARAQQLAGNGVEARETRGAAIVAASAVDDDLLTAAAITSIDTPLLWSNRAHGVVDTAFIEQVRASLASPAADDPAMRARLLATLALESGIWHDPDGAREAATRAVGLARGLAAPDLLAVALHAAYYAHRMPAQLHRVTEIGAELRTLGAEHGMPGVEALGLLAVAVERGARGEIDVVDELTTQADDLSRTYDLPHVAAMVELQRAARDSIRGTPDQAASRYEELGRSAAARGMYDVTAVTTIGRICLLHMHGRLPDAAADIDAVETQYPDLAAPMRACLHVATGDPTAAEQLLRRSPAPADDYLMTLLEGFRADAAVAVGLTDIADEVYARLLPHEDLVCGGETNAMLLGPVAWRLACIADLRGRADLAGRHWQRADEVARRAGSSVWAAMISRTAAG